MKKTLIGAGLALSLTLAACATPPPTQTAGPSTNASASNFLACMVSDEGGFDDKSFNETSYKGLMDAKSQLGVQTKELQSSTVGDYAKNVQAMVDAKCNIIVTVGFALGDVTDKSAKANTGVKYAIVDFAFTDQKTGANVAAPNAKGLTFDTAQPAFMAGYLAASMSKTGTVGTYGGAPYPTVTIFMEGYAQGVRYYNEQKSKSVKVVGWDSAKKTGTFIPGNKFSDVAGGKQLAKNLISQGADVILPVAGPASEGGLQAAQESGGKVTSMWVDSDGVLSMDKYKAVIPTSVGKSMDVAVFEAIKAAKDNTFNNEIYVGTLENKGVYLAPFHEFDSKIPAETKAELEKIQADIIAGKIKVTV